MNTRPKPDELPDLSRGWEKRQDGAEYYDGMILLCAVPVCDKSMKPEEGWHYEFEAVTVRCDEGYFNLQTMEGDSWGWEIEDVDYYVVLRA